MHTYMHAHAHTHTHTHTTTRECEADEQMATLVPDILGADPMAAALLIECRGRDAGALQASIDEVRPGLGIKELSVAARPADAGSHQAVAWEGSCMEREGRRRDRAQATRVLCQALRQRRLAEHVCTHRLWLVPGLSPLSLPVRRMRPRR
jgi:hypothetical protein